MKRRVFFLVLIILIISSLFAERISLGSKDNPVQALQSSEQKSKAKETLSNININARTGVYEKYTDILLSGGEKQSTSVTIGSGTSSNNRNRYPCPYGNRRRNARHQYLVTADELNNAGGGAGDITSIAFNIRALNGVVDRLMIIKLGHTTQSVLTTTFVTGLTQVLSTNSYSPALGWNTHTFDTAFVWNGADNLVVEVFYGDITQESSRNPSVYYSNASNQALHYSDNSINANSVTSGTLSANRANMRFDMAAFIDNTPPNPATIVSPADGSPDIVPGVTLNWGSGGGTPTGFKLYLGTDNPANLQTVSYEDLGDVNSYTPDPALEYNTTYYWQVVPYNSNGDATNCPVWRFSTTYAITQFPWTDGFESYDDFTLEFSPWTQYDGDGSGTYSIQDYTFDNQNYTGSYIIMNPSAVNPVLNAPAHGGDKYAACFAATTAPNDDWLITAPIEAVSGLMLSFWAKSHNNTYGLERFNVLVSTTTTDPSAFTKISGASYIEVPTDWTKYSYALDYPGQTIYVAIQCVSNDVFFLMVDDVVLEISNAPLISVSPASISEAVNSGDSIFREITISNTGYAGLTWSSSGASAGWARLSPSSGSIAAGESAVITVIMDSDGLADGIYHSSLTIASNAANDPELSVPLSLTVETPVISYPVQPRFVAEWEPAQGAIVRYPFGQPYSLLADLSNDALLYVIVSSTDQSAANSNMQSNGVNMANVRYINAASDSYWIRDYAPLTIFDANHNMHLVDFEYNRPRNNDNAIPSVLADYFDIDLYDLDMIHTGGNIMTDGMGKAMSTEWVLSENSALSQAQINLRFSNYLGISEYQIYTDPHNTYINHIDCWAKLLDVDKVLIHRVPPSHAQYAATEESVSQWQSKTSSYGTPYQIFRVDTPNDEPYVNSFIMNGKIYVPQMGTANDAAALAVYESAMPGFEISGYTYSNYESTDALHCRVSTIFDDQMIAIRHIPPASLTAYTDYCFSVKIDHQNALDPNGTFIFWSTSPSGPWQQIALSDDGLGSWNASLNVPDSEQLYYYFQAEDSSGRTAKLPLCADLDPFSIDITYDYHDGVPAQVAGGNIIQITEGNGIIQPGDLTPVPNPSFVVSFEQRIKLTGNGPWSITVTSPDKWVVCLIDGDWQVAELPDGGGEASFSIPASQAKSNSIELKTGNSDEPPTLPVELSSFTVAMQSQAAILTWVSQSETNMIGYQILRNTKNELNSAQVISAMIPATNSSQMKVYLFRDQNLPGPGDYYYWLQASDLDGSCSYYGPVTLHYEAGDFAPDIPLITHIQSIYPNPFNPTATISYALSEPQEVSFDIFNQRGQIVRRYQIGHQNSGRYKLIWDSKDDRGHKLGSGVYFIRMQAGKDSFVRKAVLMK